MQVEIIVKNKGDNDSTAWTEVVDTEKARCFKGYIPDTPKQAGQHVVDYFNRTRRPYETERELVGAREYCIVDEA